jgi:Tetratricopeptide repeat
MGEADEIQALLRKLEQTPDDFELRGRAADALDAAGRRDEALAALALLINVGGHDDDTGLPCLCKACLPRSGETAEAAGMTFRRSFAVARNRVLHFWTPRDLDRPAVRRSVAEALHQRLARKAAK